MQEFQLRATAFWEETAYVRYKFILDYTRSKKDIMFFCACISRAFSIMVVLIEPAFHWRDVSLIGKREHVVPPPVTLRCLRYYAPRSFFPRLPSSDRFSSFAAYYPSSVKLEPASSTSQWTRSRFVIVVALIAVLCAEHIIVTTRDTSSLWLIASLNGKTESIVFVSKIAFRRC